MPIRPLASLAALSIACAAACAPAPPAGSPGSPATSIAIVGVTVLDGTNTAPRPGMTVLVERGRISEVGRAGDVEVPAGALHVDGAGRYLIPGLTDAHVHLGFTGECALPLFVAHGVTSVRDMGSRLDETLAMRGRVSAGAIVGPRITTPGPVLEGRAWLEAAHRLYPPDHPIWEVAPRVGVSRENAREVVDSLVAAGVDFIKARSVGGRDFLALAAAAGSAGVPLASHFPRGLTLEGAFDAGIGGIEHAGALARRLAALDPPARHAAIAHAAARGVQVTPTLVTDVGELASEDEVIAAVEDTLGLLDERNRYLPGRMRRHWLGAMEARRRNGEPGEEDLEETLGAVRELAAAVIPMLAGSDVGGVPMVYPGSSLHEELFLMVELAGFPALWALQSATRLPPHFFGLQEELGTISPGKLADLVLLDASPLEDIRNTARIRAVVLGGRYLDREALDGLVAAALRCDDGG